MTCGIILRYCDEDSHFESGWKEKRKGEYTVIVPSLAGCVAFRETVEEAIEMAREAIEGYIETLMELGRGVTTEDDG